jgi:hypothetical protein
MTKYIQEALKELVDNFAQYYDEGEDADDPYWWGHDTNLGDQKQAFEKAERVIRAGRRPNDPIKKRATMSSVLPPYRKKAIAKAIFGKEVPAYWHGSRGEYDLLEKIMDIKGFRAN